MDLCTPSCRSRINSCHEVDSLGGIVPHPMFRPGWAVRPYHQSTPRADLLIRFKIAANSSLGFLPWHNTEVERVKGVCMRLCCHPISSGRQSTPVGILGHISRGHTGKRTAQDSLLLILYWYSTYPLRCLPYFSSREGFISPPPSSTVESNFVFLRRGRSPLWAWCEKKNTSCDFTGIRSHDPTVRKSHTLNNIWSIDR